MAEVEPKHYIIGVIIFGMLITGGLSLMSMINEKDPTFINDDKFSQFNESFNQFDDTTDAVGSLESNIRTTGSDFGVFGVLNALISSVWQTLKLLFSSFSFMNNVFYGLSYVFGVPAWVSAGIISIVTVIFVFFIYGLVFRQ